MKYNIWNKWDPLDTIVLGEFYKPEFFNGIKNKKIKSGMCTIAEQAHQDLEYYESVLKQFGCTVLRPQIDPNENILDYVDDKGRLKKARSGIPLAPLQPRDCQVVIGNELFRSSGYSVQHPGIKDLLDNYSNDQFQFTNPLTSKQYNGHKGENAPDWPEYDYYVEKYLKGLPYSSNQEVHKEIELLHKSETRSEVFCTDAPSVTVVGKDIYVDNICVDDGKYRESTHIEKDALEKFRQRYNNFRINTLHIGGHNDGCFHTLKPGVILSIEDVQNYDITFPGWDVLYIKRPAWTSNAGFKKMKQKVNGKWWVPEQEDNDELTHFIETTIDNWTGYTAETIFDVNCVVVDPHNVIVCEINDEVKQFCKKHKIEPVVVPWRHRFFFDGGLHCITLDLKRNGKQEDYFPTRTDEVICNGFD
jgi:hypothetical protein